MPFPAPPREPAHHPTPPPPRPPEGSLCLGFPAASPAKLKQTKPSRTPDQKVAAERRSNYVWGTVFLLLVPFSVWCGRTDARAEVFNEAGVCLLALAFLAGLVLITLEPFYLRRRRAEAAAGNGAPGA